MWSEQRIIDYEKLKSCSLQTMLCLSANYFVPAHEDMVMKFVQETCSSLFPTPIIVSINTLLTILYEKLGVKPSPGMNMMKEVLGGGG